MADRPFATSFNQPQGSDEPGLVLGDDNVVYLIKPDRSRIAVGSGGALPFPLAAGEGVPGFDFVDTYTVGTLYYETVFGGLYLKSTHQWDVSAAVSNPLTLPNLGITEWCRIGGDNNGWPVPGICVDNSGSVHIDSTPGHASFLSDLEAFEGSGNGLWWNWLGGADGAQVLVAQVGVNGAHQVRLASADGSFGPAPGGIFFPTADPHIAGAWWDNAGTLTKSLG